MAQEEGKENEQSEQPRQGGGVNGILFAPDVFVWNEARKLVSDRNTRVEDLATCASQDPSIVIELIKTANALYFSVGKSPITSVKTALVRLGSDVVLEIFDKLKERQQLENEKLREYLEIQRSRCKRISLIARMLAEALTRTMSDDCHTAGLLSGVGDMLAVAHLKDQYLKVVEGQQRSSVLYRLMQDLRFDVEKIGLNYLRKQGIPEVLLFAFDRDARSPTQERAIMKPICLAATEMIDAFDSNKWEKLAPGRTLPPKSALRSLQVGENIYLKLYERASEYLFSSRLLDEKQRLTRAGLNYQDDVASVDLNNQKIKNVALDSTITENSSLEDEISQLLNNSEESPQEVQLKSEKATTQLDSPVKKLLTKTEIKETEQNIPQNIVESFSLESKPKHAPRISKVTPEKILPPKLATKKGSEKVESIASMFDKAKSSEELLAKLLEMLTDKGGFEKSALMVISKDRKKALVVAARGPNIGNGQVLVLDDPFSPLAQCFSKVQSWGNKESEHSPFGSKSFALSPIDADHDTPVALYADCGNNSAISFEARRVFRIVVEILNQKLPELPGGIPIEVSF